MDFPCHPAEPLKIDPAWERPVACLVCGEAYALEQVREQDEEMEVSVNLARGPEDLPVLADKVLCHLVEMTEDRGFLPGDGVSGTDLAARVGVEGDHLTFLLQELKAEGVLDGLFGIGQDAVVYPTTAGRRRVVAWREQWQRAKLKHDREIQWRILEQLDLHRRDNVERHRLEGRYDVKRICADLGAAPSEVAANARRLLDQGKIGRVGADQLQPEYGYAHITELGIRDLERGAHPKAEGAHVIHKPAINIVNSTVGTINTGIVESISSNVQILQASGASEVATGLKELVEAVSSDTALQADDRIFVLENLEALSRQATLPTESRNAPGVLRALLRGIGSVLSAGGAAAEIWSTWGPQIAAFFHVAL